jgi:peptidoglycan biosynthesis protein MviN/MurJ (putative lipid II flippase)
MRKKATILFLLKFTKIPLSIVLLSLTAKYFGVSLAREVWLLAYTTMLAIDTAFWGPINESFRAKFIFIKVAEGENIAIKYTQSLLFYIFVSSTILMFFIFSFPEYIAYIIAPKYHSITLNLLIKMLVYAAPILLLNQAILIGNSILNAYEVFFVPEISGFVNILINIILLIYLTPVYGVYALMISYFISVIVNLLFILYYVKITKIPLFKLDWNFHFSGFKMYFIFALPLFFPYFLGQVNSIKEKSLATSIGIGTVSTMDYANRLPTMMYAVVISIISTILLPVLAESYTRKNIKTYIESFQSVYQIGLLLLGFVVVFIFGASQPLIYILYQSKNITHLELNQIIELSKYYSISLLGIFLYTIFGMSMMASGYNKKYAFLGIITQLLVIFINSMLIEKFGVYVFPISITIAHIVAAYFMFVKFPYSNNKIKEITIKYLLLIIFATLLILIISYFFLVKNNYLNLLIIGLSEIIIIILIMFFMKFEEFYTLLDYFKKIKKKLNTQ